MEANGNYIHPTAIVEPGVKMGRDNYVGTGCVIKAGTIIGNGNRFEAFVMVGMAAEKHQYFDGHLTGRVVIGNYNVFREFVTIHSGTTAHTHIGCNCTMLTKSHLGHDVIMRDGVTLSCGVLIGGHSLLFDGCNFGLNACCHQFSRIGHFAMVGMGAVVTKKSVVEPFDMVVGVPAERIGENRVAIERNQISDHDMQAHIREFHGKPEKCVGPY